MNGCLCENGLKTAGSFYGYGEAEAKAEAKKEG